MVNNIVDASYNDDQFQTISGQDNVFSNVLDGNNENNVALPIPTTTTEFNFEPGFLNLVKPSSNLTTVGPNPMQTLLYEVSCFGLRMNSCSNAEQVSPPSAMVYSKVSALDDSIDKHLTVQNLEDLLKNNDKQKETYDNFNRLSKDKLHSVQNLDDLLKNNDKQKETYVQPEALSEGANISTDLTTVAQQLDQNLELKKKSPAVKARANKVHKIKTVSDLIEKLETEIASGNFSEEDCEGKRQVIASLMRNYKNNLNKPCGPYDNIPPPPGFKAPPPRRKMTRRLLL